MEKVKTKVRFTSLDVAAMVQNLQRMIGMRATNIYDLNPSTYIIKLAKSEQKALILIQNGVRFHTVDEKTEKKQLPSGFTMKFRKFLRSKRLESIRQVGVERVVVFTFGTEAYTNHLILQLYAQGNIILTDSDYKILQCIRSHEFNDQVKTAVGEIYPFQHAANIYLEKIDISAPKIQEVLALQSQKADNEGNQVQTKKKKKNNQKKQGSKLRDIVFKMIPCLFPAVIENILMGEKIDFDQNVSLENIDVIQQGCKVCFKFLKQFLKAKHSGYLYAKKQVADKEDKQYFQFSSYKNIKFQAAHATFKFDTFDSAVAEYFSKYKKSQHQEEQQFEELAWKKYEQIKKDQESRVKKLQEEQDIYKVKAEYIQKNLDDVEAIIKIIKTMENNGYSWDDIQRMVFESKKKGDPLANMIHQLNILKRQVTILLGDPSSEEQHCDLLPVEINIDYNAFTNATMYYESKKKNYQKQLRTKEASQQVLKIAEKDALKIIERKKNEQFSKNIPTRKQFWFEKFYWFISSEGVLVISGRDSHQNQLIVKRYMKPGDLYMHSDYGGAASTVIKVNTKEVGVPRTTIEEAAIFTVCRSKAWDTKILSGAWWVYHDQVSKSAPTGQFLPTGSFMIRGKRNFVQPNRMEMGITFLFKIDQQSAKRHINDRKIHQEENEAEKITVEDNTPKAQQVEQFAIISVEANTKQKAPKNQGKGGKQQNQPQLKKQQSKKPSAIEQKAAQSQNQDDDSDESEEEQQRTKQNKKQAKQTNDKKKVEEGEHQPKQRMKNKRKLKKLEKYLEEQDEEQREMIMKMIGARQMKHRQEEGQAEDQKVTKGKKKNKDKKKGIDKYIGSQKNQEISEKLNPDKVLFFKKKEEGQEKSETESEQEKKQKENVTKQQPKASEQSKKGEEQKIQEGQDKQNSQNDENDQSNQEQEENQEKNENEVKPQDKKEQQQEVDEKALNSQIAELFKLVGKSHPEDKIENLVTMCAPYNSMKDNRFKIKLVPGGLKKGKAARNILHYFINSGELSEIEKPLVKSIPEQEIINSLIGNVKLAGAGLLKLEQKEKADKKTKRKENQKKQKNG